MLHYLLLKQGGKILNVLSKQAEKVSKTLKDLEKYKNDNHISDLNIRENNYLNCEAILNYYGFNSKIVYNEKLPSISEKIEVELDFENRDFFYKLLDKIRTTDFKNSVKISIKDVDDDERANRIESISINLTDGEIEEVKKQADAETIEKWSKFSSELDNYKVGDVIKKPEWMPNLQWKFLKEMANEGVLKEQKEFNDKIVQQINTFPLNSEKLNLLKNQQIEFA